MNVIICDDNLLHLDYARSLTEKYLADTDAEIRCYHSARDVIALTNNADFIPHIAILNVEINGSNGIQLAEQLNRQFPRCQIIFISAFPRYASDVYQVPHVWFVLKNHIEEYLPQAIQKAQAVLNAAEPDLYIIVKQKHSSMRLDINLVFCMERIVHHTQISTVNGALVVRQTPVELLQTLPENTFIRCHQSYWVNASKISSYVSNEFHLIDGTVIPVSRTFKKEALALFCSGCTVVS